MQHRAAGRFTLSNYIQDLQEGPFRLLWVPISHLRPSCDYPGVMTWQFLIHTALVYQILRDWQIFEFLIIGMTFLNTTRSYMYSTRPYCNSFRTPALTGHCCPTYPTEVGEGVDPAKMVLQTSGWPRPTSAWDLRTAWLATPPPLPTRGWTETTCPQFDITTIIPPARQ